MATTHTLPAGTIESNQIYTAYTDPIDVLTDKMGHSPALYAKVMDSMAWMLDASCITQARNVLFTRYAEADKDEGYTFSNFCLDVHCDLKHSELYALPSGEESPEQTLAYLLSLRRDWHDSAQAAVATDDRDYTPKSLREQLEAEKPSKADVATRINFQQLAKLEAMGDEAAEKRLYEAMIEADTVQAVERAHGNKELIPTILEILRTVSTYSPEHVGFEALPLKKQKQLTSFALGAIDRTSVDLAKKMKKQPLAYARIAEAAFQTKLVLNRIIRERFLELDELENTPTPLSGVELTHGRNAKRVACAID